MINVQTCQNTIPKMLNLAFPTKMVVGSK